MVFKSFDVYLTGIVSALGQNQGFNVPISFRAKLNKLYIKYIAISGQTIDNSTPRSTNFSATIIGGLTETTQNLEVGSIAPYGYGGTPSVLQTPLNGFVIPTGNGSACYQGEPLEVSSDFVLRIDLNPNLAIVSTDDFYFYITIGYDV